MEYVSLRHKIRVDKKTYSGIPVSLSGNKFEFIMVGCQKLLS